MNPWESPDLLVETGSRLYGTDIEGSDVDLRGFAIPEAPYLLGRKTWDQFEETDKEKGVDTVIWNFKKFFELLERFSPNVAEILFAPPKSIVRISPWGQHLINHRHLFVSKGSISPIKGFAHSEWKKATQYFEQMRKLGAKRKADIATFGYSIKNAYHACRLLEEALELLETGTLTFPRINCEFLKRIRLGEISEDEVTVHWEYLIQRVDIELEQTLIPSKPSKTCLDKLYYEMVGPILKEFNYGN